MTRLPLLLLGIALMAGGSHELSAQEGFVVIVNQANPITSLRTPEVSKLFLRKRTKWATGTTVEPVDQAERSAVRAKFSQAIHRMDVASVKSFWQEVVFAGRGQPPLERPSDAEVLAYVTSHPDAIGYVSAGASVSNVKVVTVAP